ncbi:hypothetical protein ACQKWADRAFT_290311 [Trichoderma austrokoningii]
MPIRDIKMYNAACLVVFPLMPLPTHSVYHPLYSNLVPLFAHYYDSNSDIKPPEMILLVSFPSQMRIQPSPK